MAWLISAWMIGAAACAAPPESAQGLRRYDFTQPHMGVPFRLLFYAADDDAANGAAQAAFARIKELNRLLSDYDPHSELSRLSRTSGSGRAVPVSEELWFCLQQSYALSVESDGAFDVTVGPYVKLWRRARRSKQMPADELLAAAREAVGYRWLRLDPQARSCELIRPNMQLDLGGIAKGYAADEALRVLRERGVARALVDASGDLALGDPPPGRAGWTVGIAPLAADAQPSRLLSLRGVGVATSGDAFQHVEIDGRRYSHIINPRTGVGLTTRSSVTVIAPSGALADALASAVSVLGPERGMRLVEKTPGAAAVLVVAKEDAVRTYESAGLKALPTVE